jgi:hypothetical protein
MLDVPLDYSTPEGTRAAVPLIKIAAQDNSPNGTYQGMLLINPGMFTKYLFIKWMKILTT